MFYDSFVCKNVVALSVCPIVKQLKSGTQQRGKEALNKKHQKDRAPNSISSLFFLLNCSINPRNSRVGVCFASKQKPFFSSFSARSGLFHLESAKDGLREFLVFRHKFLKRGGLTHFGKMVYDVGKDVIEEVFVLGFICQLEQVHRVIPLQTQEGKA